MNRRLLRKLALLLAAVMVLSLCGCSEGGGNSKAIPFSETISGEGPHIWYECQNRIKESDETSVIIEDLTEKKDTSQPFGRETRVVWIKVYQDGKLTTYSCSDKVYLGYFAKMTDEEILNALKTEKDRFAEGQSEQPYNIYLYTDSAGQKVMYEGVPAKILQGDDPMYFMTMVSEDPVVSFQVYDSYYSGYELYNYDETMFGEACMITRCDKGTVFGLDSMDLEGAVVDYYTPEDLLNELNATISSKKKKAPAAEEENAEDSEDGEANAEENSEG